jgi:CheY-like chemotaxis protein
MPRANCVVVVDDERAIVDLVCEVLTDEGFIALSATDGPSALTLIAAYPPSLLLVDMRMPEMSGAELIGQLRADGLVSFPIVMMTGSPEEALVAELGISAVLPKPFELEELVSCVAQFVERPLGGQQPLKYRTAPEKP